MTPILNGRFLDRQITGVERYGGEVLRFLGDRLRILQPPAPTRGWRGHAWEQFTLPYLLRPDEILWSPANTGPLLVRNQVITIHDLSPFEHPEWFRRSFSIWYRLFLPLLVRRVKAVIVPSEYVRRKVLARFSLPLERVVCILEGVDIAKFHPSSVPTKPYLLCLGTFGPGKNLLGMLKAWEIIHAKFPEYSLILAGSQGNVFRPYKLSGNLEKVEFPGYVPETELPALYAGAALFILPSFDEGFGLTALEAMACGTPVIASKAGALPEVLGEASIFFDPQDPSALAAAVDQGLTHAGFRESLSEKGLGRAAQFSWQNTAERVWQVLQLCE